MIGLICHATTVSIRYFAFQKAVENLCGSHEFESHIGNVNEHIL